MSETKRDRIPTGWAKTTLGAIRLDLAVSADPAQVPERMFELYSVPSHEHGTPDIVPGKRIGSSKRTVEPNTVLLCKINPRINRVWVTGNHSEYRKIASTEWIPFFPLSGIDSRYLAYFLRQNYVRDYLAANASGVGGSLMRIRAAILQDLAFRLAPRAEQSCIAEKLDELFSDLDAGVAALERVRDKLKRYRASVLMVAVEGTLTADWRAAHSDVAPASELLKRILVERRQHWEEEQIRKFEENGKVLPKNWRTRYKEPIVADTAALPPLPGGWCWATFDQIGEIQGGLQKSPARVPIESHFPYLRVANVHRGVLDLSDLYRFELTNEELKRLRLEPGDILIVEGNGSRTQIGRCAIWSGEVENCVHQNHIIRLRPLSGMRSTYIDVFLNSPIGQARIQNVASSTSGLYTLSVGKIRRLPIALPNAVEQDAIAGSVEELLSVIDHLEVGIDAKLKTAQGLRQAILRRAFTGRLVLQNPSDEPASELLKRIADEREARKRETTAAKRALRNTVGNRAGRRGLQRRSAAKAAG